MTTFLLCSQSFANSQRTLHLSCDLKKKLNALEENKSNACQDGDNGQI